MRRSSVRARILGLITAGIILAAMNYLGWLTPIKSAVASFSNPLQGWFSRAGQTVGGWGDVIGTAGNLAKENARLRQQVANLQQQVSEDTEIKTQNEQLRQQLGLGAQRPEKVIAAEVVAYQPDNFRQFITISRGSKDGLRSGMAVVYQGALVGTVQEVTQSSAKVFLVIDPNFRLAAIDQDAPNRPSGTIRGQLGGGMLLDKVAQTDTIKAGDTVITSGLGDQVPKGIIIGHIQSVDKRDNGVFQTAQVATTIPFSRLEVVFVTIK